MNITITEKDLEKRMPFVKGKKYRHVFSPSGMLIDELAYCAGQWTSEELYSNNFEYEPNEPYSFDYEADLFSKTKTATDLLELASKLDIYIVPNDAMLKQKPPLQAGASCALHMPEKWQELLTAYTEKLKEDGIDSISEAYSKQLQKEKDSFNDDQYREWLNGDRSNYAGVVYEIAKYFTDERDGSYNKEDQSYTFTLNEYDIETAKDHGYKKNQLKSWLLDRIINAGYAREEKENIEIEKRKAERERLAIYKKKQAEEAEADRKAKLLSMTIKS